MQEQHWRLGTMGFGYTDWAGVFYPPGTRSGDYLAHYAKHFDTVELDTTFYAHPPPERIQRWVEATPDNFRFCMKMPRSVTHDLPVRAAVDDMLAFTDVVRDFGDKLGVILLQFPPSFTVQDAPRLKALLSAAPADLRYAVELRDGSWGKQSTIDLLRKHRTALVAAEYLTLPRVIPITADFLYVRWIGQHEQFQQLDHEQEDMGPQLNWWQKRITETKVPTIWGFFNNDYAGYAIRTCNRMKELVGLPVREDASPTLFPSR
jgi:uncharacterized protein YecE (DUF72 family)